MSRGGVHVGPVRADIPSGTPRDKRRSKPAPASRNQDPDGFGLRPGPSRGPPGRG